MYLIFFAIAHLIIDDNINTVINFIVIIKF